jgi:hypothetical protein
MLGDASASMTLGVYAGLFGDDLNDVVPLCPEHPMKCPSGLRLQRRRGCDLRVCRSRLWESHPRPTHYEIFLLELLTSLFVDSPKVAAMTGSHRLVSVAGSPRPRVPPLCPELGAPPEQPRPAASGPRREFASSTTPAIASSG